MSSPGIFAGESFTFGKSLISSSSFQKRDTVQSVVKHSPLLHADKAQHFMASVISTVFIQLSSESGLNYNFKKSKRIGIGLTFSIGVAKEIMDSRERNNHFCWLDLMADVVGIFTGVILINQP